MARRTAGRLGEMPGRRRGPKSWVRISLENGQGLVEYADGI